MSDRQYITITHYGRTDRFEIVEEFPKGYMIWNISEKVIPGYLPLCRLKDTASGIEVDTSTLKAIKVEGDGAGKILKASIRGFNTLRKMEWYANRYGSSRNSRIAENARICREAIPAMKSIT